MPRYRVEFSPEAASHVTAIQEWWLANRPASPEMFASELRAAVRQLRRSPGSGQLYPQPGSAPTRRLLLPRSKYHIYYRPAHEARVVRVYAVWHTARGSGPLAIP